MTPQTSFTVTLFAAALFACSDGTTERGSAQQPAATAGSGTNGSIDPAAQQSTTSSDTFLAEAADGEQGDDTREGEPSGSEPSEGEAREPVHQTPEEAQASDLAAVAESKGWTLEEAENYQAAADAVGQVAAQIDEARPDVLVGSAVGPEPTDPPRVYIKGPVDDVIRGIVDAAPVDIVVIDQQPYSGDELRERTQLFAQELERLGFSNFGVGADIQQEGLLEATVQRVDGAPQTEQDVISQLPESIRNDVSITFSDEPVFFND